MLRSGNTWLFLLLCAIWGSTWLGIKAGIGAVPPLFFAGTRFAAAGAVMLAIAAATDWRPVSLPDCGRLAAASVLMVALCYGALFWGMLHVDSGTAAVIELGLTPVALLGFALVAGEELLTARKLMAMASGIAGLVVLFGPEAARAWSVDGSEDSLRVIGGLAIASAAVTYGWGSTVAGPLLRKYPTNLIAGATTLIGGGMLLAVSLAAEPGAQEALSGDWGGQAWVGWFFLVIFVSIIGYTIFIRLLRDIGASRAGMYAFVSPIVAVLLGVAFNGETLTSFDLLGMAIMLLSAWLAMSASDAAETPCRRVLTRRA